MINLYKNSFTVVHCLLSILFAMYIYMYSLLDYWYISFIFNYFLFQNKTRLFNIYGITEVSSWASCHEIDIDDDSTHDEPHPLGVPIGEPLLGTRIELRGKEQKRIFIGKHVHVCMYALNSNL